MNILPEDKKKVLEYAIGERGRGSGKIAEKKKYNFENAAKNTGNKEHWTDPVIPVKEADEPDQDKNREKTSTAVRGKAKTD